MIIILILFIGFILRLINLNQSLWLDEAVQAITAKGSFSYIFQEITGDFHPPLNHFLMHFWVRIFGYSEIALRMPSVLFGVGTVYLLYKINGLLNYRHPDLDGGIPFSNTRKGIPPRAALGRNDNENSEIKWIGAVFLATAPFHIYYSQEARMYSMACFLASLSMYFFIKINKLIYCRHPDLDGGIPFLDRKRKGFPAYRQVGSTSACPELVERARNDSLLYFVSTLLLIYTDYYGFLVLLAQVIYLLIKKKYKFLLICLFAYLLIYVPWLPMLITQIRTGMLATQTLPGWEKLVNLSFLKAVPLTLIKFTIGRITIFDKTIYGLVSLGILGILGILGRYSILSSKFKVQSAKLKINIQNENILILLWFFVPILLAWFVSLFVPNYQPFRLLVCLPAFYLILSMGIENISKDFYLYRFRLPTSPAKSAGFDGQRKAGMTKKILICVILFINLISLSVYYFNPYFYREDWRGLTKYLSGQSGVVILPSQTSNWPIKYYDPKGVVNLVNIGTGVGLVTGDQLSVISDQLSVNGDRLPVTSDWVAWNGDRKIFYIRYLVSLFDPSENILAEIDARGYTKVKEVNFNQIPVWEFNRREQ